jgi:hypothetical protein
MEAACVAVSSIRLTDSCLNCHCSMCRKAQGSAFRSRAAVKSAEFEFVQGEELITFYESSPGNHRGFCRVCGSPIYAGVCCRPQLSRCNTVAQAGPAAAIMLQPSEVHQLPAFI